MLEEIILKKKDGSSVKSIIKLLDVSFLDKIINLQEQIYNGLENKEFYSCTPREEFERNLKQNGKVLGCIIEDTGELIAIGVSVKFNYDKENYGYDLDLEGEELLKVANFESTIVHPDYRGNKLQQIIVNLLLELSKEEDIKYIGATASPLNKYSVDNIKSLGFKIVKEKLKYGGLRRYIFLKEI